jgi:hypothetical protein
MSQVTLPFTIQGNSEGFVTLECPFCESEFKVNENDFQSEKFKRVSYLLARTKRTAVELIHRFCCNKEAQRPEIKGQQLSWMNLDFSSYPKPLLFL